MDILEAGISGIDNLDTTTTWDDLSLNPKWLKIFQILAPNTQPRPVQIEAVRDKHILINLRNLIISSPTNSGKSLVGLLMLLDAVDRNKRTILIEPLRALAQEKLEELSKLTPALSLAMGRKIKVTISTGDYRLEHEVFAAPPPDTGEIVIVTPERLDAILRNPEYDDWVNSIGAVTVDEAHLLRTAHRGPTLEYVITFLRSLPNPPRIALLSATMGNLEAIQNWLSPCDVIEVTQRYPTLAKKVIVLEGDEKQDEVIQSLCASILADEATNLLIFVYQTQSAVRLAKTIKQALPTSNTKAYHAQMSSEQRQRIKNEFEHGACRCLVTTTALALGVNLPASHVIVRDTTFYGRGYLEIDELLQMMGRAGRGEQSGTAMVIIKPTDSWNAKKLVENLQHPQLPDLKSHFADMKSSDDIQAIAEHLAAYLARNNTRGLTLAEIERFFNRSLAGSSQSNYVQMGLRWLTAPRQVLAFQDEFERYHLTTLGLKSVLAALPLPLVTGFAQLLRDILTINPDDNLLSRWTSLDLLIILHLLHGRTPTLRQFSQKLVRQVDTWMESHPQHDSVLFRKWIAGTPTTSRANEILGSLGIASDGEKSGYKLAYLALFQSIILLERSHGVSIDNLSRQWQIKNLNGIEERWRDDFLWLLGGIRQTLDLRCFYYHLREMCQANDARIHRVKKHLQIIKRSTYELQEQVKYCSPLGTLLIGIRQTSQSRRKVGIQTIRRIEDAGITSLQELAQLSAQKLTGFGIQHDLAEQIMQYIHRRQN